MVDNNSYIKKETSKARAIQPSPRIITSIQVMTYLAFNRQRFSYLLSQFSSDFKGFRLASGDILGPRDFGYIVSCSLTIAPPTATIIFSSSIEVPPGERVQWGDALYVRAGWNPVVYGNKPLRSGAHGGRTDGDDYLLGIGCYIFQVFDNKVYSLHLEKH